MLFGSSAILFADISGFTNFASNRPAREVVTLVTTLFSAIDAASRELETVYKVCTIGDCYVAVNMGDADSPAPDPARGAWEMLLFAWRMLEIIADGSSSVANMSTNSFNMRAGIHYGCFLGGVIGKTQLRFDVWGQDVRAANLVEQEGVIGSVCCSGQFREVLEGDFGEKFPVEFEYLKSVVPAAGRNSCKPVAGQPESCRHGGKVEMVGGGGSGKECQTLVMYTARLHGGS
eukprot:g10333.t1